MRDFSQGNGYGFRLLGLIGVVAGLLSVGILAATSEAYAEWTIIPESHHQQYNTYGLLIDNQTSLYLRTAGRAWVSIAGNIALFEKSDWESKPQLVMHGSANSGFRLSKNVSMLLTETTDARVGLAWQWSQNDKLRMAMGWQHQSGHISDNVVDKDLIGSNLGFEILYWRVVKDIADRFRVGGTLKPYIGTDPGMKTFAADQFFEWFPCGTSVNPRDATPYLAAGLEEYGQDYVRLSWHVVTGVYYGNHLNATHMTNMRVALGFYSGVSPQLKYMAFKQNTTHFGYLGMIFDL